MTATRTMEISVNGEIAAVEADGERSLLSVLRDELGLTGTKYGCGEARCGACVVLIDGEPQPSCVTSFEEAAGRRIVTIEGLAPAADLHPVQQAFLDVEAMQCGYCTPGMIVEAVALLEANPGPSTEEIVAAMDRHICRCGAYSRIVRAINRAAADLRTRQERGDGV